MLIERGANTEAVGDDQFTSLHLVVRYSYIEIVKTLLENGADTEAVHKMGWTPLFLAASVFSVKIVQMLLEEEANIGFVDRDGEGLLLYGAARSRKVKIVKILLEKGEDVQRSNSDRMVAVA